jgi:two-component system, cell cycle sensor histidine kinase and response regulator CckA
MGYQVLCASDGEQAIQLFRSRAGQIKAVILDLAMPRVDGVQAFAEIRRIRADIPVLVISGYSESEVLQRFHEPKPDAFLQKPFTFENLGHALDRISPD